MKLLKRIIEAAFLMASIMLLASDQCMVLDRRYRSVCGIPPLIVAWEEDVCDEMYL